MRLVVLDGPMSGHVFPVARFPFAIGRAPSNDACLPRDPLISRFHCQVVLADDGLRLEDLGSGNGTWIEGREVEEPAPVVSRQSFRVGHTHLCLLRDGEEIPDHLAEPEVTRPDDVEVFDEAAAGRALEVAREVDPRAFSGGQGDLAHLRARLDAYERVGAALSGKLEPAQLHAAVLDAVLDAIPADRAFLLEVDIERSKVRCLLARRRRGREDDIRISRTLLRKAVREKVAALVHDTLADDMLRAAESVVAGGMRSVVAVPILDGERVAALLYLDSSRIHAFTEDDLELACVLANQAGLALANSRLYAELRAAYDELESAHDRMVESEKLSVIGTLSASIAHDMGNAVTPISGVGRLLASRPDVDPKLRGAFERGIERLKALTTQLKSMAKPKAPEMQPLELAKLVDDAVALLRTEARHAEVKLVVDVAPDVPRVRGDANRLDQVLVNLVVNAVHALGEKGGEVRIRAFADRGQACVAVSDTGPGIPPEVLPRLFQAFYTTKGKKGTGLGLFSSKRIVEEEHGGRLEVSSPPGQGATFTIRLPALD